MLDSKKFKNDLIDLKLSFDEIPGYPKDIDEMIIEHGFELGERWFNRLIIENYYNLETIIAKEDSFRKGSDHWSFSYHVKSRYVCTYTHYTR